MESKKKVSPWTVLRVVKVHTAAFIQKNYNVLSYSVWIRFGALLHIRAATEAVGVKQ